MSNWYYKSIFHALQHLNLSLKVRCLQPCHYETLDYSKDALFSQKRQIVDEQGPELGKTCCRLRRLKTPSQVVSLKPPFMGVLNQLSIHPLYIVQRPFIFYISSSKIGSFIILTIESSCSPNSTTNKPMIELSKIHFLDIPTSFLPLVKNQLHACFTLFHLP